MLVESPPHKNHKQKRKTAFSPQTCETVTTTRYKIYKGLDTNHCSESSIDEFQLCLQEPTCKGATAGMPQ